MLQGPVHKRNYENKIFILNYRKRFKGTREINSGNNFVLDDGLKHESKKTKGYSLSDKRAYIVTRIQSTHERKDDISEQQHTYQIHIFQPPPLQLVKKTGTITIISFQPIDKFSFQKEPNHQQESLFSL